MHFRLISVVWLAMLAAWGQPAWAELAIIVNRGNPALHIAPAQVAQIFLGGSAQLTPIEQADEAPVHAEFCRKVLKRSPDQVDAIWSKIVFSARGKPPREYKSSAEVKRAVAADLYAIGYIEKSAVDDSIKVVAIVP